MFKKSDGGVAIFVIVGHTKRLEIFRRLLKFVLIMALRYVLKCTSDGQLLFVSSPSISA